MSEQAIVLNQLTKHYGTHRGINDLSFSVNEGEFFGFIGPNGAGKSTTIRTLMGLIHPSGGNASIFGLDCQTKASVIAINKDGTYTLQAGILKLTAKPEEVYLLEDANKFQVKKPRPAHSGREMKAAAMPTEIDLRGMDAIEAICVLDRFLDEAMRSNLSSVRIIHGKGTGTLRAAVQEELRRNKFVKKFRLGVYGEGEDGVTIAEF